MNNNESSLLMEAEEIINGERAEQYGDVSESFGQIADLWTAYLSRHVRKLLDYYGIECPNIQTVSLSTADVANLMILMKVSRAQNGFHRDSYVDIAGYAGCVEKMV